MSVVESIRWRKVPAVLLLAVVLMLGALGASQWLKPSRIVADELAPIDMKTLLPERFGDWHVDRSGPPVIYDPNKTSPTNGQKGSYVALDGGRRYLGGQIPSGEPDLPPGV